MIINLSFNFQKNPSCLKVSRILLKNDDTMLEFRRTWRFLTGAGVLLHILDVPGGVLFVSHGVRGVPNALFSLNVPSIDL